MAGIEVPTFPSRPRDLAQRGSGALWKAILLFAAFQAMALLDERISDAQRLRELAHWLVAQVAVFELWRRGLGRWIEPVLQVALLEALKLACERDAGLLGGAETATAVIALTLGQAAILALFAGGQRVRSSRLHRLLRRMAFAVPLVLAGTFLIEAYVVVAVRQ